MGARCACSRATASKWKLKHMAKDKDPKDQKRQDAKPKGDGAPQQPKAPQQAKRKDAPKAAPIAKEEGPRIPAPPARLGVYYREKVVPELMQKFGYKTVMQVPRIKK